MRLREPYKSLHQRLVVRNERLYAILKPYRSIAAPRGRRRDLQLEKYHTAPRLHRAFEFFLE